MTSVSFDRYEHPYFVKNTVKAPEGTSVLTLKITDPKQFDETFGVGRTMGKVPPMIPNDYFDTHVVAAYIEWGKTPWRYEVCSADKAGDTLIVKVKKEGEPSETATFSPHIIIGVKKSDMEGVEKVVFDFFCK